MSNQSPVVVANNIKSTEKNMDNVPKQLDHFRRGYKERSLLRNYHDEEKKLDRDPFTSRVRNFHGPPSNYGNGDFDVRPRLGGFNVTVLVDQICEASFHNQYNRVRDALFGALEAARPSFESGKAITSILALLARRRKLEPAFMVWQWMDEVPMLKKNIFHYNALITCCEKMRSSDEAIKLMKEMDHRGIEKNDITYSSAISACEKSGKWRIALDLLDEMYKLKIPRSVIVFNAAISACEKGINPNRAMQLFTKMKEENIVPTVITYSALISAAEKGQQWKLALQVLEEMKGKFPPNVIAYSATISALSKGQQWETALSLFRELQSNGCCPSVVTYNATINALEKGLQWEQALDLFDEMKSKGLPVTVVSYGSSISACEKGQQWRHCLTLLDEMTEYGIQKNVIIFGAAMSCMEKSGRADISFQLMQRMQLENIAPNVHIYNSAISACARTGGLLWNKALELFREMNENGIVPDVVTYNAVIDATSDHYEDISKSLFLEGLKKGFYSRVSRIGDNSKWLELDLHFLSLGGGEVGCRWWFEDCLVPYMKDDKLKNCKSIDIVTGYGRGRYRGVRAENDGMYKRIMTMLDNMGIKVIDQPNKGRIQIDVASFLELVKRNNGKILLDKDSYSAFKKQLNDAMIAASNVPQVDRPSVPPLGLEKGGGISTTGLAHVNQQASLSQQRRHSHQNQSFSRGRNGLRRDDYVRRDRSRSRSRDRNANGKDARDNNKFGRSRFNPPNVTNKDYQAKKFNTNSDNASSSNRFVPRQQLNQRTDEKLQKGLNLDQRNNRSKWTPPNGSR